jgi:hypothetical protein
LCAIEPGMVLDRAAWSALDEAGIVLLTLAAADADQAIARYGELAAQAGGAPSGPDGLVSRVDAVGSNSIRFAARRLGAMPMPAPAKRPSAPGTSKAA